MKVFTKFVIGLFVISFALTGCGDSDDRFVSEEGGFKVTFTAQPEEQVQTVPTPIGDIEMHMFPDVIGDSGIFVISYGDLPEGFVEEVEVSEFMKSAAAGALEGFGISEVDLDEEFVVDGNSGLHQRGSNENYYSDYYNFLLGDRLYQFVYVKQTEYASEQELDATVGSFELID